MVYSIGGELYHHGVLGQKWGKRNGPPYPLSPGAHSASERKAGYKKSIGGGRNEAAYGRNGRSKKSRVNVNKQGNILNDAYERAARKQRENDKTYARMEADPKDSAVTKRVKKDFNELSNGDFFNKYKTSKDVYEKRVKKYGDPYMNAPLAKIGKALSKRNAAKKKVDLNRQGRLDSQSEEIIKETIRSMPKDQRKAYDKVMKTTSSRERDEYWKDALKENGWDAKVIPDVSKSDDRMMDKAIKSGPKETRDAYNAMSKDEQAEYRAKLIRQYYQSEGADLDYYGKAKPNLNSQGKLHPQKEPTTAKQELKSGLKRTGASVAMALASSATGLAAAGASNPKVKVGMLAASNILNLGSKVTTLTAGYHYVKAGAKVIKGSDTDLNSQGKQKKNKSK